MLEVRLLGKFEVRIDGERVEIPSRPAQTLLAYLILRAGTQQRREKLAGLLWPDSTESNARRNLRSALWRLRRAIGDAYLLTDKVSVAFDPNSPYELDVSTLQEGSAATQSSAELIDTVSVYDGRLLPGFYDDWVTLERGRLQAAFEDRMQVLMDRLIEEQRWRDVRQWAEQWIAQGQVPEQAFRALMAAHAGMGDLAGVAATYQRCIDALSEELGVDLSEETRQLYQRLAKGERPTLAVVQPARREATAAKPRGPITEQAARSRPHDLPSQPPAFLDEPSEPREASMEVFIGRERELSSLDEFLAGALGERGQVVFVIGEAGSGKTSLLNEFARRAQVAHSDLVVASGNCDAHSGVGDPYLPFRELLGMLTGEVEARWAAGTITREQALRLWRLFPEALNVLVNYGPNLVDTFVQGRALETRAAAFTAESPPSRAESPDRGETAGGWNRLQELRAHRRTRIEGQASDQGNIFEEYTKVLEVLSAQVPLMLVIDNLHWADLSSIGLLFHLAQRIDDRRILIVGAYRPEDVAQGRVGKQHPLDDLLSELKRHFGEMRVDLDSSGPRVARDFVDALLDEEPNRLEEPFRRELTGITGGHPLFAVELLRDLRERGDLLQDEKGRWIARPNLVWDGLPPRVEGVIERRIGRLDPELREALAVASVEGEDFTAELVARVQGVDERELVRQLSGELDKQHRIVKAQGTRRLGSRRLSLYRFRHHLFQKFLYDSLDPVERAYQHEAVGSGLEALYESEAEEIAVQLARHYQEAGLVDKAIGYLDKAGDAAARLYANAEAIAYYSRALALTEQGRVSSDELIHLYTRLGRVLALDEQYDLALKRYEEMERLAQERKDRPLELAALMARLTVHAVGFSHVHDPVRGEALSERALSLAHELDDQAAEARILWGLTFVYRFTNRLSQAIDCGERSLALARALNLREQMAFTLNDGAKCYVAIGRPDRAKEAIREAIDLWQELGNLPMLVDSLSSIAYVDIYTGEYEQALAFSEEAFQISETISNLRGQFHSRYGVGYVYWERGQPDRAIAVMEEILRLGELTDIGGAALFTRADLAGLYGDLGGIQRGLKLARLALTEAEERVPIYRPFVLAVLAQLHLLQSNLADAQAAVDLAKGDPNRKADVVSDVFILLAEGKLALKRDDFERTMIVTDTLIANLSQFGMRAYIPSALYLQGQALMGLGQDQPARDRLLEAHSAAEAIGSRRTLWPILYALSQLEADPTEAERLRQQAVKIVEYIADHISTPELHASFLELPQVRAVFEPVANE